MRLSKGSNPSDLRTLFLTLYPETMPSSRLRVYQYLSHLAAQGIEATVLPTVSEPFFSHVYYSRSKWLRLCHFGTEFLGTIQRILKSRAHDVVFVQKGILLSNFRGFDRLLTLANERLIFDLDDAVYGMNVMEFRSPLLKMFQDQNQTIRLSKQSRAVIAGNTYLKDRALQYNDRVYVVPTPVDTDRIFPVDHPARGPGEEIVIGWLGTGAGLEYFSLVGEALQKISARYRIRLRLVTLLTGPSYVLDGVKVELVDWALQNESRDMNQFDLAINPLFDAPWEHGKCSLKLLQYMAAGLPTVSSRSGMNSEVIEEGVDGFLAQGTDEWVDKLSRLIEDPSLRKKMGRAAREKVTRDFSLKKMAVTLADILKEVGRS